MPKKTAKKAATKVAGKKTTTKRSTSRSTSRAVAAPASSSIFTSDLRAQQVEFHKKHTSANNLIGLFIFSFCVLVLAYLYFGGMIY